MARLKELYENEIKKSLKDSLKIGNDMAIPRLKKITINMGVGKAAQEKGLNWSELRPQLKKAGRWHVETY